MADPAVVFMGAIFCACYLVFLMIVLAVGILSRLDPVPFIKSSLFSSFYTDSHTINMVYSLIRTLYTQEEGIHWVWG